MTNKNRPNVRNHPHFPCEEEGYDTSSFAHRVHLAYSFPQAPCATFLSVLTDRELTVRMGAQKAASPKR